MFVEKLVLKKSKYNKKTKATGKVHSKRKIALFSHSVEEKFPLCCR
jgi:hypothetical protein